ncbi:MAG: hypothetical protein KDK36_17050, partial [Leptospiraceae bacterium]|nr:hypothetical protein [Leptospiraceae bacterium]
NSSLSADTKVNGGVKNNPYIFQFRRANIQKKWENGDFSTTIIFGIQELPHVYSQWKNYWDWRYIDRAPMESLGFAPAPADLGLSTTFQYSIFQFYLGVMNGEGYRQIQNTESGGFDVYSRLSIEKEWEKGKLGIHFISRLGNLLGAIGNECREGKTDCLASDSNISTSKEKDLRSIKTETFGIELNAGFLKIINYGVGAISRRKFGGLTYDRLNLSSLPEYEKDLTGRAGYVWLSYMYKQFTVGYKYESGTGNNGVLNVFNSRSDGYYYYLDSNSYYRSKEKFKRILGFIEYNYDETLRFAIGYAEVQNFDKNRYPKKIYIDTVTGEESNEAGYLSQWNNSSSLPKIVSYNDRKDRQLFFKTMISF